MDGHDELADDIALMDALCRIESGLTEWEMERIDEWAKRVHRGVALTPGQRAKAVQIEKEKG